MAVPHLAAYGDFTAVDSRLEILPRHDLRTHLTTGALKRACSPTCEGVEERGGSWFWWPLSCTRCMSAQSLPGGVELCARWLLVEGVRGASLGTGVRGVPRLPCDAGCLWNGAVPLAGATGGGPGALVLLFGLLVVQSPQEEGSGVPSMCPAAVTA